MQGDRHGAQPHYGAWLIVGTRVDLQELLDLAADGKVNDDPDAKRDETNMVFYRMREGRIEGRPALDIAG